MVFEDRTTNIMALATVVPLLVSMFFYGVQRLQEMMVYPSNVPEGSRENVATPDAYQIPYEDVRIKTTDGESLQTYVMLQDTKAPGYKAKTVVMFAPNAGNIGHTLPIAKILYHEFGYHVVTFSYRGYGLSTGTPSETGIKTDAVCVLRYLADHPVLGATKLVLYGRSLGGAVALYFATLPQAATRVSGIVLENTFLSIVKLIPEVVGLLRPLAFLCTQRWDSETTIRSVPPHVRLLFLSGARDELVPPAQHRRLFDLSRARHKYFKSFPDGAHNNTVVQPNYWLYFLGFAAKCDPREEAEPVAPGAGSRNVLEVGSELTQEELEEFLRDDEDGKTTHAQVTRRAGETQGWISLTDEDAVKAASISGIKDVLK